MLDILEPNLSIAMPSSLTGVVLGREGLADRNLCQPSGGASENPTDTESQTWPRLVDTQVYVSSNVGPHNVSINWDQLF